ncbi:MAG: hypothetical protein FIA95_12735 [Gemmatimonadetes bacterium]|nr:hypothetical protein [Gemmatimonadota bacterium]
MASISTFQGLATGINFRDLVDQIIQAESAPVTLMKARAAEVDRRVEAWGDFQAYAQTLSDRAEALADGTRFRTYRTSVTGHAGESAPVVVSAGTTATPASYLLNVSQLATREKLAGDGVASASEGLGRAGAFLVGGREVVVAATDSLTDVAASINGMNRGASASGVGAAVVAAAGGGYRLVLTAAETGREGISVADVSGQVLESLGVVDGTTSLKAPTSDGALSSAFSSTTESVGDVLGLSAPPAGSVGIGGLSVAVDLATDTLQDIADASNAASAGGGISAAVVPVTDASGRTSWRLDISGTTSFSDSGHVLEALGVEEGGRSAVAQSVAGAALTGPDGVTPGTAGTLLVDVWSAGSDAHVQAGDTLTLAGTRGDGSTFQKTFTVGAGSTYGDLVSALNSAADGFGAGARPALAAIGTDGALSVTDGTAGDSRLSLSITAHNEGGGRLDLGAFGTTAFGRARELAAGQDAEFELDGAVFSRSSNTVTDVAEGVTFTLLDASGEDVTVAVDQDVAGIVADVTAYIKAYNALAEFVNSQFTGVPEGEQKKPLSGDGVLREMRTKLRAALQEAIPTSVTTVRHLSELGITLGEDGTFDVDAAALTAAVEEDPLSVERFFAVYGGGSTGALEYVGSTDATVSGEYDIQVSVLAERAVHTGAVLAGPYADDGTPDTLTVTDADTGSAYAVSLSDGMTLEEIVSALNSELQAATARRLEASEALAADALGTPATDLTSLQDLHRSDGTPLAMADGDTLTLSGVGPDGSAFLQDWTVTDVATQTLGDLRAVIEETLGTEVDVSLEGGILTVTAVAAGRSGFTLVVTSDNLGGGAFTLGTLDVAEAGRTAAAIAAYASSGALSLAHADYGASAGFDLGFTAGGASGFASLGLTAGSYRGVDVAGTSGGQAAEGEGRLLVGAPGTSADGLIVEHTGSATGWVGSVRFSRGIASLVAVAAESLLAAGGGGVKSVVEALDTRKEGIESRIERFEARMDLRYDALIRRFTALEEAMSRAQQQMSWLQSMINSLSAEA